MGKNNIIDLYITDTISSIEFIFLQFFTRQVFVRLLLSLARFQPKKDEQMSLHHYISMKESE